MESEKAILNRAYRLLGDESMERLAGAKVIIFGIGGVGSWCAESLIRTGVRHLTIVDSDIVCVSNINRQLMATTATVGHVKVDALRDRLLSILPTAEIKAIKEVFNAETASGFNLDSYDYIIDAIDSLKDKVLLIEMATRTKAKFYSSMGAALKLDPTRIKVAEFWKVSGCPLARALRQRFKKLDRRPAKKFLCVYSDELLTNRGEEFDCDSATADLSEGWRPEKAQVNGSLMHITAIFGLTIAGLVIKHITERRD
ncbi:MAG: tRNA threonylcarbamoyladenosine dehydratase [Staphylococcus sp.]|nr:tRNA threonylcarbamoyladenosine dehydratase [Staphylococcus sp.]